MTRMLPVSSNGDVVVPRLSCRAEKRGREEKKGGGVRKKNTGPPVSLERTEPHGAKRRGSQRNL